MSSLNDIKTFIKEIIKENAISMPLDLIEPEVSRLIKNCFKLCKQINSPMIDGNPSNEEISIITALSAQAQDFHSFFVKNNHPNRALFQSYILQRLAALKDATSFKNRPTFFGKTAYTEKILDLCKQLKNGCDVYVKKSADLSKRYG